MRKVVEIVAIYCFHLSYGFSTIHEIFSLFVFILHYILHHDFCSSTRLLHICTHQKPVSPCMYGLLWILIKSVLVDTN